MSKQNGYEALCRSQESTVGVLTLFCMCAVILYFHISLAKYVTTVNQDTTVQCLTYWPSFFKDGNGFHQTVTCHQDGTKSNTNITCLQCLRWCFFNLTYCPRFSIEMNEYWTLHNFITSDQMQRNIDLLQCLQSKWWRTKLDNSISQWAFGSGELKQN